MTQDDILRHAPFSKKFVDKISRYSPPSVYGSLYWLYNRGFFSEEGLSRLIDKNLDFHKVTTNLPVYATCRKQGHWKKTKSFSLLGSTKERMKSILLASSAIPWVFGPQNIDGVEWCDGGLTPSFGTIPEGNTPIRPLQEHGCRMVFAVLLDMDDLIDTTPYADMQIVFIYPQNSNGGIFDGALDFDGFNSEKRMCQGYADTRKILEPIFRIGNAQFQYAKALQIVQSQEKELQAFRKQIATRNQGIENSLNFCRKSIDEIHKFDSQSRPSALERFFPDK
jgi:NTE family protein